MAVHIFRGPMKPWKHSRMGMRPKLPRKAKQRREKEESGRERASGVERENELEGEQRVGFLRRF